MPASLLCVKCSYCFSIKTYNSLSVGEILSRYEENTRDFLFPAPKFTHQPRNSVREVLMKKAYDFTVSAL